jgi:DNA-directed RNA polymerase
MNQISEEHSAEVEAARERYYKLHGRTEKNFGYGQTEEALHISQGCYERLEAALKVELAKPVTPGLTEGWDEKAHRLLVNLPPHVIALAALNAALRGVMDEENWTPICIRLGEQLRHELFSFDLDKHDKDLKGKDKLKPKLEQWVKEKHGNLKYRLQAARSIAKKEGFSIVSKWTPKQEKAVGHWVMDVLVNALPDLFNRFMKGNTMSMELCEGAEDKAHKAMQEHIRRYPIFLPSEEPPLPWSGWSDGGPVDPIARKLGSVVRTRHKETIAAVKAAINSGQMQPALDALNAVQAVGWRINTYLLNVMKECKRRGIEVEGLPSDEDVLMPELARPWDEMGDEEKKLARVERAEVKKENRGLRVERMRFDEDTETADALSNLDAFFIPHNLDWRGREYPMTNFNFQREDRVRSLFLFRDGEPIGEEGLQWLKVHVANCGDFKDAEGRKVSKRPYEERIKWVDDNITEIQNCAQQDWEHNGPLSDTGLEFWTKADKPFLFLAACVELTKALSFGTEYVCALPCSWDGSCSGAQHLCAATRSEDAWKVNLCDREEVHDLYVIVGNGARAILARSTDPVAQTVLAYDGDWRKVFKRNTMTTFYGSKGFGMAQQHMTDLMEPLRREVLKKKRKKHPFGSTYKEQHAASSLLAAAASETIAQELPLAMQAMKFLQDLAGVMAHAGKPLEWVTPTGLPWSNRYHASLTYRVKLWMHDQGVRRRYDAKIADGCVKPIDRDRAKNGSAPNFVHACDAAHLLLTVNAARSEGITQFALVHDSFGSLPSHAARFQGIIRETFVEMYEKHDVLAEVLQRAQCDLSEHNNRLSEIADKLPDLRGSLNIKEVLNAKYAFA